jgi:hypothetical protein
MNLRSYILGAVFCVFALSAAPVRAQQQTPDQTQGPTPENPTEPIPAIRSPLASAADNGDDNNVNPQQMLPDTNSITGVQNLTLGSVPLAHNYIIPRVNIFASADSNGLGSAGGTGWEASTSLVGGVDVYKASERSTLMLNYLGGGSFSNNSEIGNAVIQQLGVNEKLTWRRVTLTLIDQLAYIPESSFGYNGFSGIPLPGGGSTGLQNGFTPGDTILTTSGQRLTNSFATQLDTQLSRRTSLTFVGGYTFMRYFDNDLLDLGDMIFQAGYNYQLSRTDTIAVLYRFSGYRYTDFGQSINDNVFQLTYAKRVTGRISFQIAAGPEYATFSERINPNSTSGSGTTSGPNSELLWSLNTSIQYALARTNFMAAYSHGVSGGSGVLGGSIADTVTGSANHQFSRTLHGGLTFGYSRNKGLATDTGKPTSQTYDSLFGGVNFTRPFGRTLDLNVAYLAQHQSSNAGACVGTGCAPNVFVNEITVGLNWHHQPIAF